MTGKTGACRTPGTVYEVEIKPDKITLIVMLPRPILGSLSDTEETAIAKRIHDAALPTIEWVFSRAWREHFAGRELADHAQPMPARHEQL
jgi:hypothetical protein